MAPTRIKVLFIIDYFHRTGGTERHLAHLVTALPADQFECAIVCFDLGPNPLLEEVRARGIPVEHMPVAREYVPSAFVQGRRLAQYIKRGRFDIVQTFHQKADTYGAVIARLAGVRHLVSSKRDTGALRQARHFFLNRRLRGLFERIIVVADAVAAAVVKNDHLDPARLVKIYNGVDTDVFAPAAPEAALRERAQLGLSEQDFVVGMVAGFRPEKNHDIFFAGLAQAYRRIPSLKVLAVGGGPLLEHYRAQAASDKTLPPTIFPGDVRHIAPFLHAMDVGCLLPGSNEGFSNAVIEAMSTGLPMIVTNVGGNAEAVRDEDNGFVIPPLDAGAFARAVIELHENPTRRAALGRRSRQRVEEEFSLAHMCAEHARLYRSVCAQPLPVDTVAEPNPR
jgi:glycosyltransferase involved in cell wall biosynthesis